MSGNDLDLDAILADFHAEEKKLASAPAPAPGRRRAEPLPPQTEARTADPLEGGTARYVARTEKKAPQPKPAAPQKTSAPERPAPRRREPDPAGPEKPYQDPAAGPKEKAARAAARRKKGRVRMAVVLVFLLAALAGLTIWAIRDERANAVTEPDPVRMSLGVELDGYLTDAAIRNDG